jgi:hypothetical protein
MSIKHECANGEKTTYSVISKFNVFINTLYIKHFKMV